MEKKIQKKLQTTDSFNVRPCYQFRNRNLPISIFDNSTLSSVVNMPLICCVTHISCKKQNLQITVAFPFASPFPTPVVTTPIPRHPRIHNQIPTRKSNATQTPPQLVNALLQMLLLAPDMQPTVPLPIPARRDLPHLIQLHVGVCRPEPGHQIGCGGVHGDMVWI